MAHMIDESTGKPAFVFDDTEGGAWHGLGHAIPEEHACDPAKIAELAQASYKVHKAAISYSGLRSDGRSFGLRQVPNRMALYRDDTGECLEVLSDSKYKIVQPVEYFEAFRDTLKAAHLRISSAGVLKGGRVVFVNAKLTDAGFDVLGADRVNSYFCLGGGYDGKMSSFGFVSALRTVCNNTLSANLHKHGKSMWRIPHTVAFDGKALTAAMGLYGEELKTRSEVFNKLAQYKLTRERVAKYFCDVMGIDQEKQQAGDIGARTAGILDMLANAYLTGPGAEYISANGTAWGALNAVTHYVDHLAATRDSYQDGKGAARFASAQFGNGAKTKARALELAMGLAGLTPVLQAA